MTPRRHEGRTWYSTHRGRLWIAAAAKKPTEEEVNAVENSHRQIVGNGKDSFQEIPREQQNR